MPERPTQPIADPVHDRPDQPGRLPRPEPTPPIVDEPDDDDDRLPPSAPPPAPPRPTPTPKR